MILSISIGLSDFVTSEQKIQSMPNFFNGFEWLANVSRRTMMHSQTYRIPMDTWQHFHFSQNLLQKGKHGKAWENQTQLGTLDRDPTVTLDVE